MKKIIEDYERKTSRTVTKEIVEYLYENIDKAEELKKILFKKLVLKNHLTETKKYVTINT